MSSVIGTHRSVGRLILPEASWCTYCDILEYAAFTAHPFPEEYLAETLGSGLKYAFFPTWNRLRRTPGLNVRQLPMEMSSSRYRDISPPKTSEDREFL